MVSFFFLYCRENKLLSHYLLEHLLTPYTYSNSQTLHHLLTLRVAVDIIATDATATLKPLTRLHLHPTLNLRPDLLLTKVVKYIHKAGMLSPAMVHLQHWALCTISNIQKPSIKWLHLWCHQCPVPAPHILDQVVVECPPWSLQEG